MKPEQQCVCCPRFTTREAGGRPVCDSCIGRYCFEHGIDICPNCGHERGR